MTYNSWYECIRGCGRQYSLYEVVYRCEECGGLLDVEHDMEALKDRSAVEWKRIFDERTYADLLGQGTRPFIVINATDVARRQRFQFTQEDFDLLGSDLSSLPAGWAVAASSAYPILLSPLRLKYHPGDASTSAIQSVMTAPEDLRNPRRYRWAASLRSASPAAGS